MTRTQLIARFQQWIDTNPDPKLIASECATIAQEYARELIPSDEEIESMFIGSKQIHVAKMFRKIILEKL